MCGLVGFLDPLASLGSAVARNRLAAMADAIRHRGPDEDGLHTAITATGGVWLGLGHRRLSIIDLSSAGSQPMMSHCRRYVLAYNGEIYNFQGLRDDLDAAHSISWRGHSDTEVLLEAIAHMGLARTLGALDGMFALAVADLHKRRLYLARDAFGEKPLSYGLWDGILLFGSELRALERWPGFSPGESPEARSALLNLSYIPAPLTIYHGFNKLLPGSILEVSFDELQDGRLPEPVLWWDKVEAALSAKARGFTGSMKDAVDTLDGSLGKSTRGRMLADVPLGALLSGGIDSTLTAAMMRQQSSGPVRTYTIGMDQAGYDESPYAEAVARHLGTEHQTLMLTAGDVQDFVPTIASLYDEPFADSSQVPTYLVSKLARTEVTVALSGDGGDELFAGYHRHYLAPRLWKALSRYPAPLRGLAARALQRVPPAAIDWLVAKTGSLAPPELASGRAGEKAQKFARVLAARQESDFHRQILQLGDATSVFLPGAGREMPDRGGVCSGPAGALSFGEKAMLEDVLGYLHDDVLAKVDRASMAVSLETRTPFLNRELFEFAWTLPMAYKTDGKRGKLISRELAYRHVPRELVDRPKAGFAMPIGKWLRGSLAPWVEDLISEDALRRTAIFDPASVRRIWIEHASGRRDHEVMLWSILMYQGWHEARRGV